MPKTIFFSNPVKDELLTTAMQAVLASKKAIKRHCQRLDAIARYAPKKAPIKVGRRTKRAWRRYRLAKLSKQLFRHHTAHRPTGWVPYYLTHHNQENAIKLKSRTQRVPAKMAISANSSSQSPLTKKERS